MCMKDLQAGRTSTKKAPGSVERENWSVAVSALATKGSLCSLT